MSALRRTQWKPAHKQLRTLYLCSGVLLSSLAYAAEVIDQPSIESLTEPTKHESLGVSDATVDPLTTESTPPWSEAAMPPSIDAAQFQGVLPRPALQQLIDAGEKLFSVRFTTIDGAGRPLSTQAIIPTKRKRPPRSVFSRTAGIDANACSSCHNVPKLGGAGDFSANAFVSEGFQHSDFDTTDSQFSNERNTNHLFGSGLIELLAREMTQDLQRQREQALIDTRRSGDVLTVELQTKGVRFGTLTVYPDGLVDPSGIEGIDQDLVIRPFSHKGVMTSLRQFTINALNQHHGIQAMERFGTRWTGEADFDEDQVADEMTAGDVSALVAWQASLAPPTHRKPTTSQWQAAANAGQQHFKQVGCDNCHKPQLSLDSLHFADPGPLDAAGTLRRGEAIDAVYDLGLLHWASRLPRDNEGRIQVPLFGDLKRHVIADQQLSTFGNELLSQRFVERNVFMTTELWGLASTAPYGHRGDLTTLSEAIDAHGGAARSSRDAWKKLNSTQKSELIAWLKTLVIEP